MEATSTARSLLRLLRSPPALGGGLAFLALAFLGGRYPLLEVPGFDLGLVGALAFALLVGPALGLSAARRELAAAHPPAAHRPAAAAAGVATALVALLLGASALRSALATPCRPLASASVFLVVAWPSALLSTGLGVLAGLLVRGARGQAALLYAAVLLASLATTLAAAYFGPTASAYDHLLGVWPGPLYDEAVALDARLLLFRVGTLCLFAGALALAALVTRRRAGVPLGRAAAALAAALAGALAAWAGGGGMPTRAAIAAELGGVLEGPGCTLHFPREKSPEEAERALRDCEYDAQAVARALGLARPRHAEVFVYRSPEEKRRLTGAGRTSYTKPWLAEIHLNDQGVPHPLLRHELVHALASAAAPGPLGVPARAGVLVNAGLIEGLAVALEVPEGSLDVHGETRVLRDLGLLPPLAALLGPGGFFGAAPARAYTAAGSFVKFLLAREGPKKVLLAYALDDVPRGVGEPLEALDAAWQRFLDGVVVPPAAAAAVAARFERGSLFVRACVREVAELEGEAARRAAAGRAGSAEALFRRASALSGGDPALLRPAAEAWRARGDLERAQGLLEEALDAAERAQGRRALRAALEEALGDLRWRDGDRAGAEERYRAALGLGVEGAEARLAAAKLAALADPGLAAAVGPWLLGVGDPALALARVAGSDAALARYLLARARLARGAPRGALEALAALARPALPGPAFALEARRMAAAALCGAGRFEEGTLAFGALAADEELPGDRERARDAALRCAFERDRYGRPVPGPSDWPPL